MENVFVYEMILVSFRVPHRIAKDMLYIVTSERFSTSFLLIIPSKREDDPG
jgi:hypothetical protein